MTRGAVIKAVVIILSINVAAALLSSSVQSSVNSHYEASGPAAGLFFVLAIAAAALAARSYTNKHGLPTVLTYTLLSASFAGWACHARSMVCQGCLQSG